MTLTIISADERIKQRRARGVKALIVGESGVGKTWQARTLPHAETLVLDSESGDLSIADVPVAMIKLYSWQDVRDSVCRISGPNSSYPPSACFSEAHYRAIGGPLDGLDGFKNIFLDSLTSVSRLALRWAQQQPESFTKSGEKDLRSAYGLAARELLSVLQQLQYSHDKNVIMVGIFERVIDDVGRAYYQIQMEGKRTGRELPGIVDELITLAHVDYGDGELIRSFVCKSPNRFRLPGKDRSGRLNDVEPPDLGRLISKLLSDQSPQT